MSVSGADAAVDDAFLDMLIKVYEQQNPGKTMTREQIALGLRLIGSIAEQFSADSSLGK